MTRFARAKGSKASNERIPEDATSWSEMKQQLLDKSEKIQEGKKKQQMDKEKMKNYKAFLNSVEEEQSKNTKWAEFPTNKPKKAKKINYVTPHVEETNYVTPRVEKINYVTPHVEKINYVTPIPQVQKIVKKKNVKKSITKESEWDETNGEPVKKKMKKSVDQDQIPQETFEENNNQKKVIKKKLKKNLNKKKIKKPIDLSTLPEEEKLKIEKKKQKKLRQLQKKKTYKQPYQQFDIEKPNQKLEPGRPDQQSDTGNSYQQNDTEKLNQQPDTEQPKQSHETKKPFQHPIARKPNKSPDSKKSPFVKERRKQPIERIMVHGREIEIDYVHGFPVKKEDAERLKKLYKEMISKGLPRSAIDTAMKLERRKAEKALAREKKRLCYNCRKPGHNLSECPNLADQIAESAGTGVCFKCGSTEHTHYECKVVKGQMFNFAQCFVCHEQGHIAKQCPDNPKGLYPNGGCCNTCGDVTHLKKDCPVYQAQKEHSEQGAHAETITDVDNPDNLNIKEEFKIKEEKPAIKKIIKF